jgi:membrane-bound lytic murein transglycosylase F
MQLLPSTGESYGVKNLYDPAQNIKAGVNYIIWLDEYWSKFIKDKNERINFILASYNIGFGHIEDARRLAEKYGANPNAWFDSVDQYLLKKSKPKYYNDEVVRNGYCNGKETYAYVKNIIRRFERYSQFI